MPNVIAPAYGRGGLTILPSAARTATPDSFEYEVQGGASALILVIDVTAIVTAPTITVTIAGVDRVSGKTYTILASAAIVAVGTTVLKVGPGLPATANVSTNDYLPPVFRVTVTHGNGNSITYSVAALLCGAD